MVSCSLARGYDAVCIFVNDECNAKIVRNLKDLGIRLILLRCAGFNNVDLPGVYLEGKFGVRVENTMLVKRDDSVAVGEKKWFAFEPLTLCPIDTAPIEMDMIEQYEKDYLNDYHTLVREKLLPLLSNPDDKAWLVENTKKI